MNMYLVTFLRQVFLQGSAPEGSSILIVHIYSYEFRRGCNFEVKEEREFVSKGNTARRNGEDYEKRSFLEFASSEKCEVRILFV